jgi:extradiol dioxygenase family protein
MLYVVVNITDRTMMKLTPFHLAVQVRDLEESRDFYGSRMGLEEGRSSEDWIDFNMFGHQFVVHLNPQLGKTGKVSRISNAVDGHGVPVPHFGVVMNFVDWEVCFSLIPPVMRWSSKASEMSTQSYSPNSKY